VDLILIPTKARDRLTRGPRMAHLRTMDDAE
jgi:hypothetical protein